MSFSCLDQSTLQLNTDAFNIINIAGKDAVRFLSGHTTTDINKMSVGQAELSVKTDRTGRLLYTFYILKSENDFNLLVRKTQEQSLLSEFNKFIIMDDVNLTSVSRKINIVVGGLAKSLYGKRPNVFEAQLLSYPAVILLDSENIETEFFTKEYFDELMFKTGSVFFDEQQVMGEIVNSTLYMEEAVDLDKGCFLGQETIKKIANNRGAAYYPSLIKLNKDLINDQLPFVIAGKNYQPAKDFKLFQDESDAYLQVNLKREQRVDLSKIEVTQEKMYVGQVQLFPLQKNQTTQNIAKKLFYLAIEHFQHNEEKEAERLFRVAIKIDPENPDIFESLGVLLGRNNKFEEAISLMDQLLNINPDSVMAHTNKSLYLMKVGKIEEAEEEKALATVSSFKSFGKEATAKKLIEEAAQKKIQDLERKESMFKQVIEIDEVDIIANFGMGEISFQKKDFHEAQRYLEIALNTDPKHSRAYLMLGKVFEQLELPDKAIEIYQKGIKVASKKGEMMPANEMQSLLISIQRVM